MEDYADRSYLSAGEVANYLAISVKAVHDLVARGELAATVAASGQHRFDLADVEKLLPIAAAPDRTALPRRFTVPVNGTRQTIAVANAQVMQENDDSVHLVITSPPYFNAKMYSPAETANDLGDIHSLPEWLHEVGLVWREVFRVLQPGRKFFLNIMNLPVRQKGTFRTLNLVGKSIDLCEEIGFVFKRDIVWQKTNGVRAHFGTYPYPGGILLNNMHEFILEFQKPDRKGFRKYAHLTPEVKEASKLDKEFWLSLKNSDVWLMKPEQSGDRRPHVAPFPLDLPHRLIKAYSYIGETVLDPLAGSGTTLLAAARLGRHGVGYEINGAYAAVTRERLLKTETALSDGGRGGTGEKE
ncbi:MAG: DNA methyltransferase [bacterium]|jgi:DNA modification methylase